MTASFTHARIEMAPRPPVTSGGLRLLVHTLRAHRRDAVLGISAGLAWSSTKLAIPLLLRRGIDHGIRESDPGALAATVGAVAGIGLLGAGFAGLRRYYGQSVAARVEADLRERLFVHVLGLDIGFHARMPAGDLVSRCASDLQQIQQPFVNIPITVSNIFMLVGAAVMLASLDPVLAAVALGPALLVSVVAWQFARRLGPRARRLQQAIGTLAGIVQESISGIRAVKGLGLEAIERTRARGQAERAYQAAVLLNETRATFMPLIEFLPAAGLVGVLWLGGSRVAAGEMTLGQLVSFDYYVLMLVGPLRMVGMTVAQLQRAVVSAGRIESLLSVAPKIVDGSSAVPWRPGAHAPEAKSALPAGHAGGEIHFDGVEFGYDDSPLVLRGLDLRVRAGETIALVGATGSGKTTLTGLIGRFHDVTNGRVSIDGVDVRDIRLRDLRANVGMVFEDPLLFSGSIRDNIALGRPEASDGDVERAARAAGAHDFIVELEGGYHAAVGERGHSLSGGQRQRIALARALLTNPRVLVLDAATTAVDASKEDEIRDALAKVLGTRTTILIGHRAATLQMADRVLLLEDGRIAASGTHAELVARNDSYRRILASIDEGASRPFGDRASSSTWP
ncbi:MAG: ABC transporter ATP-binding protein [Polyangiaceae bacterium]